MLNHFHDGIDFSVNVVKLFDFASVQEEFEILIDGTCCVSTASFSVFLLALDSFANRFERLVQVFKKFRGDV